MSGRIAVVLQARMGSTRLPGKSLAPINGRTVLERAIERLRTSGLPVVVATTTEPDDDAIVEAADRVGAPVVLGDAEDVLSRFALAAFTHDLDVVIRATADNPAVDMDAPMRTLELQRRSGADYVCEHGLPYGAAVEAVVVRALLRAAEVATAAFDREHVTPLLRRDRRFTSLIAMAPTHLTVPGLRLTVDVEEDLLFMRILLTAAEAVHPGLVPLALLIDMAETLRARDAFSTERKGA